MKTAENCVSCGTSFINGNCPKCTRFCEKCKSPYYDCQCNKPSVDMVVALVEADTRRNNL